MKQTMTGLLLGGVAMMGAATVASADELKMPEEKPKAVAEAPGLFGVGLIWISIHAGLLLIVGYLIKAPVFFLAVGSQANVGGAASAPVVAPKFVSPRMSRAVNGLMMLTVP